jgi:hypothetical protein
VAQACGGIYALCEMQQRHYDVVVTDYHMSRFDELDLLVWRRNPSKQWSGSVHRKKEERIMGIENADADETVLNMLQRYEVLMMEDLITGRPDFSWAQLFLAIDRLSRKDLIALRRVGLSYQIRLINQVWTHGQGQHYEEPVAHHG